MGPPEHHGNEEVGCWTVATTQGGARLCPWLGLDTARCGRRIPMCGRSRCRGSRPQMAQTRKLIWAQNRTIRPGKAAGTGDL